MSDILDISRPQHDFIFSKAAHPAIFGGFGSGKSQAGTYRLVKLLVADYGISVSHFFPTYKLAKRRGLPGIRKDLTRLGYDFTVNKTDLTVYVPEVDGTIYLETYHDPDAIVSFEVAHAVVDELDVFKKEEAEYIWQKVIERVRQPCRHLSGNTVGCVTTPDQGRAGFCFEKWGDGQYAANGFHYIKAGTRSNKFLPEGYADQIAKNYDPVMAEAFLDGGWVSFNQNRVYHFFNRTTHVSTRTIQQHDRLHIGLDFNIGGCCAVVFVEDKGNPVAVHEFTSYDTRDFINNLARFNGHSLTVYPDASGGSSRTNASQSDIAMIQQAGYQVCNHGANPAIRDRVNAVNGLLAHSRLLVNTYTCPNFTHALETQGYDAKGDPEKWDTHPAVDDWVDGAGYCLAYKYPITRPLSQVRVSGT